MVTRLASIFAGLLLAACASAPQTDFDWSLEKLSREGKFRVALMPPEHEPALHQIHSWSIRLMKPDGTLIEKGLVYLNGGMPDHGHGLPTRPETVGEIAPGVYRVEGVKFNMPGRWELIVAIQANGTEDFAYFNKFVDIPKTK
ncbi:MAG: FixH family protein [Betaproteobacteria bacterium]|nr:FixH family protein [Betaproteobacteria bacterium]